ncbi:hypothetical protein BMS3Abin07_00548 [bacterium BMS3Abin07]|nr:hypothetical protein BMS3Abin07_00548 [bacterium BMS3Abin07]GBE32832.1 hypothetical protein BMS3Bbin05_01760 [bacterium BMS3Bbin05]
MGKEKLMKKTIIAVLICSAIVLSGAWYTALAEDKEITDSQQLFESK